MGGGGRDDSAEAEGYLAGIASGTTDMKPRELIGTAKVPGGVELKLFRHGDDHVIMVDGNELMSSRVGGSEEALALIACERLGKDVKPHLLIGGYGMGFTLRAALGVIGPEGRATVAELAPEIIDVGARADGGADGGMPR